MIRTRTHVRKRARDRYAQRRLFIHSIIHNSPAPVRLRYIGARVTAGRETSIATASPRTARPTGNTPPYNLDDLKRAIIRRCTANRIDSTARRNRASGERPQCKCDWAARVLHYLTEPSSTPCRRCRYSADYTTRTDQYLRRIVR